ncbi:unnamed protein product [Discula destructiva]
METHSRSQRGQQQQQQQKQQEEEEYATTNDHRSNGAEAGGQEEPFEGDNLADEMSRVDLSSLLPSLSSPTASRRDIEPATSYPILATPSYRSPNSIEGRFWHMSSSPNGTARAYTPGETADGSGRTAKYRDTQRLDDDSSLSPDLVNAIFREITRRQGHKRFARLCMDDRSGRWHIVRHRYSTPPPEGLC